MITTIIIIIILASVIFYKLYDRYSNAQEKKWRFWATEIGMNYIPIEKKGFFEKMKEYKSDINNPRVRRRKDKIMSGSAKGADISGYFVYEIKRRGTKERMQPTKFELEFFSKEKNYPELIIQKKEWLGHIFVKIPESMKVQLPPHLENVFEATSARPAKAAKIVNEISSLLSKDMKNIKIFTTNYKASIIIKRSRVTSQKLFTMRKIGIKILETGENHAI